MLLIWKEDFMRVILLFNSPRCVIIACLNVIYLKFRHVMITQLNKIWHMWACAHAIAPLYICIYIIYNNENMDCENKLNRNVYNALRRVLFWNIYYQKFHFSVYSIFWKRIFLLINEHYRYLIFFIKFNYLIGSIILQLVFDSVTYSIVA